MQWTKANIAAFGGDADRIAIFGESAGGFSVCWHLVSPLSAGLFSGAIMESGSCDSRSFFMPKEQTFQCVARMWCGCDWQPQGCLWSLNACMYEPGLPPTLPTLWAAPLTRAVRCGTCVRVCVETPVWLKPFLCWHRCAQVPALCLNR